MDAQPFLSKNEVKNDILQPYVKDINLWEELVNNVGDFNYMGGAEVTSFPLPQKSQSILRGVANITDPLSPAPVRLCTFKQINGEVLEGPPFLGPRIPFDTF